MLNSLPCWPVGACHLVEARSPVAGHLSWHACPGTRTGSRAGMAGNHRRVWSPTDHEQHAQDLQESQSERHALQQRLADAEAECAAVQQRLQDAEADHAHLRQQADQAMEDLLDAQLHASAANRPQVSMLPQPGAVSLGKR